MAQREDSDTKLSRIVDHIADALETTDLTKIEYPWNRNVRALRPLNPLSGVEYRGINWVILSTLAGARGVILDGLPSCTSARFATYKQWQEAGYQVRAESVGIPLMFFSFLEPKEEEQQKGKKRKFALNRFTVHPAESVDGAEGFLPETALPTVGAFDANELVKKLGVTVVQGTPQASMAHDNGAHWVAMPLRESFVNDAAYLGVLFHEIIHWTAHRVGREEWLEKEFPDPSARRAFEELVAELGAAMLGGVFNVATLPQEHTAQYVKSWISLLRNERKFLYRAAAKAQQAVDWIKDQLAGDPFATRTDETEGADHAAE